MYRTKVLVYSCKEPPQLLIKMIRKHGLNIKVVKTIEMILKLIHKKAYRLIYIDITGTNDLTIEETIGRISNVKNDIVIIGIIPRNKGLIHKKLMNNGVFDVIQKPLSPISVETSLKRAMYVIKLQRELNHKNEKKEVGDSPMYEPLSDADIENLGLDELIKKKLSILFSKPVHKKLVNLYSIVMPIIEKSFIQTALQLSNRNQVKASILLGINRNTLRTKMRKYGIKK
ncbi:MAG: helix-turn-helix domain-containing protein [bacterium]